MFLQVSKRFYPTLTAPKRAQQCFYSEKSVEFWVSTELPPWGSTTFFKKGGLYTADELGARPRALAMPVGSVGIFLVAAVSSRSIPISSRLIPVSSVFSESACLHRNLRVSIGIRVSLLESACLPSSSYFLDISCYLLPSVAETGMKSLWRFLLI